MAERTTFVFAGGGTGGHLFPGIAVAEELLCRDPNTRIVFAGSERDVEREIIARQRCEHFALPVVPSSSWKRNPFGFVWKNWAAVRQARRFLSREGSAMIVGLGGFASVPVVWAASSLGLRIALLEQNLVPGRATRWLARRAQLICTSFSDTTSRLGNSKKIRMTGNPVRRAIADLHKTSVHADGATLLVLGGSQGSSAVNDAVLNLVEKQPNVFRKWRIVHQTGRDQAAIVRSRYERLRFNATVEPFLDDMSDHYRQAAVVVSRAGATTLAELACGGCPAVLIPYPNAIGDHQMFNARAFESAGAARVVVQNKCPDLTAADLKMTLQPLLDDSACRDEMRLHMKSLARPHAASDVVDALLAQMSQEQITMRQEHTT